MTYATPQIDYTDKDFQALRRALIEFAELRLPEWTDRSPADLGMLMVDLFSYMGDIVLYYQDCLANEAFLETAVEGNSIIELLRLIGYELAAPAPAAAELDLIFDPGLVSVIVPSGAQFRTVGADTAFDFEYLGEDLLVTFNSDQVESRPDGRLVYRGLPVRQGSTFPASVIGSSTGEANQSFALDPGGVVADTLVIEVNEGAGWIRWDRRDSLLYDFGPDGRVRLSSPDARHYYVRFDAARNARVHFGGDGRFGRRPPLGANNIRASFRTSLGAAGNVGVDTIREAVTPIPNLVEITNPAPAAGGQDTEDTQMAKRFGPMAFRARQRAVTTEDYAAMAHLAGGVAKARARARSWNLVDIFVAPAGPELRPAPESLRRGLLAFFEDRRMAGTFVRIRDAVPALIDISIEVAFDERYRGDAVRQSVEDSVRALLGYEAVDFGQPVFLSAIHDAVLRSEGVRAATIERFQRRGEDGSTIDQALAESNLPPLAELPEFVRKSLIQDVEADGRIDIGFNEIPVLGALDIRTFVSPL